MNPALLAAVELPEAGRLYKHYKGDYYRIITLARLSEDRDVWVVVYVSLGRGHIWVRPLTMFVEPVMWADGQLRQRFMPVTALPKKFVDQSDQSL